LIFALPTKSLETITKRARAYYSSRFAALSHLSVRPRLRCHREQLTSQLADVALVLRQLALQADEGGVAVEQIVLQVLDFVLADAKLQNVVSFGGSGWMKSGIARSRTARSGAARSGD